MAIIRNSLKYGLPVGFTYYTISRGLWSPMTEQQIQSKQNDLNNCIKQINCFLKTIPYASKLSCDCNVKDLWNTGVKTSFGALYNTDCNSVKSIFSRFYQVNK